MITLAKIPSEKGFLNVSIKEPGEWFDRDDYTVFIGGGGGGHSDTEKEAREIALTTVRKILYDRMLEGINKAHHYADMVRILDAEGFKGFQKEEEK